MITQEMVPLWGHVSSWMVVLIIIIITQPMSIQMWYDCGTVSQGVHLIFLQSCKTFWDGKSTLFLMRTLVAMWYFARCCCWQVHAYGNVDIIWQGIHPHLVSKLALFFSTSHSSALVLFSMMLSLSNPLYQWWYGYPSHWSMYVISVTVVSVKIW